MTTTTAPPEDLLHTAIRYLADLSEREPGTGFLATDLAFGRRIAWMPARAWPAEIRHQAWRIVGKYVPILTGAGIDVATLPEPPKPVPLGTTVNSGLGKAPATTTREIDVDRGGHVFIVRFPFHPGLVARTKAVPGTRWVYNAKWWTVPKAGAWFIKQLVQSDGFTITDAATALVNAAPPRQGFNRSPIPDGPQATARAITMGPDGVPAVRFPYNVALHETVKAIPGARYQDRGKAGPYWRVVASPVAIPKLLELADRFGFALDSGYRRTLEGIVRETDALLAASTAAAAELVVPGLRGELRPFQRVGVLYASKAKRCWIADEMGLGKTIQALATLQYTGAWPALVVCPASLKLNWEREARKWLPGRDIIVLGSRAVAEKVDLFAGKALFIVNYDLLDRHVELDDKARPKPLQRLGLRALVLDESQYVKSPKAKRTKLCRVLAKACEYRLLLTGTPILNRAEELLSQLALMGRLDELGGLRHFKAEYVYGANHEALHRALRSRCYIRRTKKEVLPELPAAQPATVPLEIDNREEYDRVAADVVSWLREQAEADAAFRASIAHLSLAEQDAAIKARGQEAAARASMAEHLVRIGALKRCAARGKLAGAVAWIRDFIDSGEKLIVFAWHRDIVAALAKPFHADTIDGATPLGERQKAVDRFQTDPSVKVIVLNLQAGGVGLTLTAASNVAKVELGWNPATHDQAIARCYGRVNDPHGATAWYLVAVKTIDEDILELIDSKRQVVGAVTDGMAPEDAPSILRDLVARLTGRGRAVPEPAAPPARKSPPVLAW